MTQILVDGITYVSFINGVLRVECGSVDRQGKLSPSGTLLIPGNQAGVVLQGIANAAQELDKRAREKMGESGEAGEPAGAPSQH